LIAVVWYVNSLSDPAYYDPQTIADYAASVLAEIFFLSAAYTLAVWWRRQPLLLKRHHRWSELLRPREPVRSGLQSRRRIDAVKQQALFPATQRDPAAAATMMLTQRTV
jgi:hypothetical protein